MARLILITGGARSGKSDYALKLAESLPGLRTFLATCPVTDGEILERIRRHKEERQGENWQTIEEEVELVSRIQTLAPGSVCLIDCLTLWINNLMYHAEKRNVPFSEDDMVRKAQEIVTAAVRFQGTLICVSNEVGMGIVPENAAARRYRDLVGRCNRQLAGAADEVIFVSCGLPLFLKGKS